MAEVATGVGQGVVLNQRSILAKLGHRDDVAATYRACAGRTHGRNYLTD